MNKEDIEIQIIHTKVMEQDNGFAIRILINDEDVNVLELSKVQMLHIGTILLNVTRNVINTYFKLENNGRG